MQNSLCDCQQQRIRMAIEDAMLAGFVEEDFQSLFAGLSKCTCPISRFESKCTVCGRPGPNWVWIDMAEGEFRCDNHKADE